MSVRRSMRLLAAWLGAAWLVACGDPKTGPVGVHWDRDACELCRMALSDRRFAVQIRLEPRGRVAKFDDIGCALVWLDARGTGGSEPAEIWVADHRDGRWLDARSAGFVGVERTPMDYGFGAVAERSESTLDLAQVRARSLEMARERSKRRKGPAVHDHAEEVH